MFPARLTPALGVQDGNLQTKAMALGHGVLHEIAPFRAHEFHRAFEPLAVRPVHAEPDIKHLRAPQADALHRLKVGGDPFLGDESDHPMPPSQRPGLERRVLESGDERISRLGLLSRRLGQATGSTSKDSSKEKSTGQSEGKPHAREGLGNNAAYIFLAGS